MKRRNEKQFFRHFLLFGVVSCMCFAGYGCESTDHALILGTEQTQIEESIEGEEPDEQNNMVSQIEGLAQSVESKDEQAETANDRIYVHVCGQVKDPGVYELAMGSRKYDAVEAAGGFLEDADEAYINLAQVLTDGEQLYVPCIGEELRDVSKEGASGKNDADKRMNLNTADEDALCSLPGIGASRAKEIIAYRETHGGFKDVREIMNVSGIKESVYEKISELVTAE